MQLKDVDNFPEMMAVMLLSQQSVISGKDGLNSGNLFFTAALIIPYMTFSRRYAIMFWKVTDTYPTCDMQERGSCESFQGTGENEMRIFIVCPANLATGGTELLHQLSWHLRNRGIENYMLYPNANPAISPIPDTFMKYQVEYVSYFIDAETSVLICPETWVNWTQICTKGTCVIWWLSVDNYISVVQQCRNSQEQEMFLDFKSKKNLFHFVQSKYAYEFVKKNILTEGQNVYYLTDYINEEIVRARTEYSGWLERKNIILFNPKKGEKNLVNLREKCRADIRWIPLRGLTPVQMAMLMCSAKVYIDFGNHPGRDRIPREAAICGCCVITNRNGSAAYAEDVGIPEKYKISDMQDYEQILEIIYDLVDHYDQRTEEYAAYVTAVSGQQAIFEAEVDRMLEILNERCTEGALFQGKQGYQELFQRMQDIAVGIKQLYQDALRLYLNGQADRAITQLLKVECVLPVLRESNYEVIEDILRNEPV